MAKLSGILKAVGTLDGFTIYITQDGPVIKKKSVPNATRFKKDPAYSAMREQAKEFGACAKAAKLLRDALMPVLENSIDNRVSPRLNKVMNSIKNLDIVSPKGKRSVGKGLLTREGPALLRGFNFNAKSQLDRVVTKGYSVDLRNGRLIFEQFEPLKDLKFPKGATHVALHCGLAGLDFEKKKSELREDYLLLPMHCAAQNILLKPEGKGLPKGVKILILKTAFLQEVNGNLYVLEDGRYNAAAIVEAWV